MIESYFSKKSTLSWLIPKICSSSALKHIFYLYLKQPRSTGDVSLPLHSGFPALHSAFPAGSSRRDKLLRRKILTRCQDWSVLRGTESRSRPLPAAGSGGITDAGGNEINTTTSHRTAGTPGVHRGIPGRISPSQSQMTASRQNGTFGSGERHQSGNCPDTAGLAPR